MLRSFLEEIFLEGEGNVGVVSRCGMNGAIVLSTLSAPALSLSPLPLLCPTTQCSHENELQRRLRETMVNPGGSSYGGAWQTSCLRRCKAPLQRAAVRTNPEEHVLQSLAFMAL